MPPTLEEVYDQIRTEGNSPTLPRDFVKIRSGVSVRDFGESQAVRASHGNVLDVPTGGPAREIAIVMRMLHAMKANDGAARCAYRHLNLYGSYNRNDVVELVADRFTAFDALRTDIFDFWARVLQIVKIKGIRAIVRNIRTDPGLAVEGVGEIRDWWDASNTEQKLKVLGADHPLDLPDRAVEALEVTFNALPCPFRWTGRSSAEASASAWGGLPELRDPSVYEHDNEEAGYWSGDDEETSGPQEEPHFI